MISPSEVSVVIQGAVHPEYTKAACGSVRQHLPGACIILSTWEGSDVSGFEYDELVLNKDPGAFPYFHDREYAKNNVDRQILSTLNGLKKAKTKYALKMRTDFELKGDGFLSLFEEVRKLKRVAAMRAFEERILMYTAVDPRKAPKKERRAYHPGDFFHFGLTSDLLALFDVGLVPADEKVWIPTIKGGIQNRYASEQQLWYKFMRKTCGANLNDAYEISPKIIEESELSLVNNVYMCSNREFNIGALKPSLLPNNNVISRDLKYTYTKLDYWRLYKKYIDSDFKIGPFAPLKDFGLRAMQVMFFTMCGVFIPNSAKRRIKRSAMITRFENFFGIK